MLRPSQVDRVLNIDILRRINKYEDITIILKRKKLEYLSHVMRGTRYCLIRLIMEGKYWKTEMWEEAKPERIVRYEY